MTLMKWFGDGDMFSKMERLQRQMDSIFSSFNPLVSSNLGVFPPMNIYDDGESYIVRAELPGVDPQDIEITVAGNTLHVRGKREAEPVSEENSFHRRERQFGEFRRAFTLPDPVDNTQVAASSKNGILEIRLPRAEQAKTRKIQIKSE